MAQSGPSCSADSGRCSNSAQNFARRPGSAQSTVIAVQRFATAGVSHTFARVSLGRESRCYGTPMVRRTLRDRSTKSAGSGRAAEIVSVDLTLWCACDNGGRGHWRTTWKTVPQAVPAPTDGDLLSAEQRGNVTSAHRKLLEQLVPQPGATWAAQALWSCLDCLRLGTAAGAEVRVEQAWTDGPDAFCIVYTPPYQPAERVGLRRQIHDTDPAKYESAVGPAYAALLSPILFT